MTNPTTEAQSAFPDPHLRAAIALMGDPDDSVASMAMETILKSGKAELVLENIQDDSDENVLRHAHQLGSLIQQQRLLDDFVRRYEQASLDPLAALKDIDLLYDPSSSASYLESNLKKFLSDFKPRRRKAQFQEILGYMDSASYFIPPLPWFTIEEYLLGDVLSNDGAGVPVVMAILCRALARCYGSDMQIGLCSGFLAIRQEEKICILERGWKVQPRKSIDEFVPYNNQQLIQYYLCQLLSSSIACWEAYDTHLFFEIFRRIHAIETNPLPAPFGNGTALDKK